MHFLNNVSSVVSNLQWNIYFIDRSVQFRVIIALHIIRKGHVEVDQKLTPSERLTSETMSPFMLSFLTHSVFDSSS